QEYSVGCIIGTGGFGSVSAGLRIKDKLPVAIKRIPKQNVLEWEDPEKTVPKEVAILQRLSLVPNVVQLLDWFRDDHSFLLVLERPDPCQDLFNYITQKGSIPEHQAKELFEQAVRTVKDVFERGVFHLDIKSENFLITRDSLGSPSLKIIDFGAADYISEKPYTCMNLGTEVCYPPEWFRFRRYHGLAGTVWSLGLLLFDMTNGRPPFLTKQDILSGVFSFEKSAGLSEGLKDLVRSLLDPQPFKRPSFDQILLHPW
ncbi:UNVERIFIED_CONTAM: hypothetical protein GTU68_053216, partial [Idotea baltica]|nr:hypothetical protein [Idotea baltica]